MATKTKSKSKVDEKRKMRKLAPDVLTLEEAAAFLRVTEEQLRSQAQAGGMPARCLGGEWRFARSALYQWLAEPITPRTEQDRLLRVVGCLADDDTLEPMIEGILLERGRDPDGAST